MPCDTPGGHYETALIHASAVRGLKTQVRELTALLCALCTAVDAAACLHMPPSVEAWWAQHQARDRRRASSAAKAAAKSARARTAAITRLERQRAQIDAELQTLRKGGR